jgi:hypothetical protein
LHAAIRRLRHQSFVQQRTPNPDSRAFLKISDDPGILLDELDSPEAISFAVIDFHAESSQC